MKEIITRIRIDDEGNVISSVTETKELVDKDTYKNDGYHFVVFNKKCPGWSKDRELNYMYLRLLQSYANDMLKDKGYVIENDIYDMLGIKRDIPHGYRAGWDYIKGDRIDFGLDRGHKGVHPSDFLLEFNVRENIWE